MKRPEPKYKPMEVARLAQKIKDMNGESGQKLDKCLDELLDQLDEDTNNPRVVDDAGA